MAQQSEMEHPFLEHLPEFYLRDPLLCALVEVLEQPYLELEQVIDRLPETLYRPEQAPEPLLDMLCRLTGLQSGQGLFPPERLRALLPVMRRILGRKGTRSALDELLRAYLESFCGASARPAIIEYEDWATSGMPAQWAKEYPQLYRGEADFTVVFPPLYELQDSQEQARLSLLVGLYSPASMSPHLVFLAPGAGLGGMDYLGINLYL